ncbi:hypothetical protein CPB84DRAFT_941839 [Gymnopilus junonius]|uniref:Uncharacterized protein n=1 Tax=Gymnopilus junonius TaxID=109634 RepID=A0A9P5NWP6_GYMJU|nr:hypothetical protein CPB84DRAFT_941839 [Gymnopilus junonius]
MSSPEEVSTRCIGDSWTLHKELKSISLTPVEHGCLTSFRLIALTNGTVSRLLKALTLPNVQDLGLFSLGSYPSWNNDALHVFITRIGTSLRILNLCGISEYKDEIHGILQRCPNVSRFTLVADFLADGFLEQFTGRTGFIMDISGRNGKLYLSRLVSIELDAKISFTPKGFSSFIKSMFNRKDSLSSTSLRSLIIRCRGVTPQFINSEVFEELRRYQEQGRVIRIDTEYAPLFPRPSLLIRRFPERSR